jgi:1-phosphatidylinositol-3-phosphate 5-kinase
MSDPARQTPSSVPREPSIASSKRRTQKVGLTTFPLIHEDEPEQGLLPSLISKVKSTFGAATPVSIPAGVFSVVGLGSNGEGETQTEAQRIAEAVKIQQQRAGSSHVRRTSGSFGPPLGTGQAGSSTTLKIDTHVSRASPSIHATKFSPSSPRKQTSTGLKPPSIPKAGSLSSGGSQQGSLESQSQSRASSSRNLPIQNRLKPRLATVTTSVTPVVSVTHSVAHKSSEYQPVPGPSRVPFPVYRGAHTGLQTALHGHKGNHLPLLQHAQNNRVRRSSIATLPDSPSSTGLSNLISGNAEISQNRPYMGGFSLGNDDSKSVRSVAIGKKGNKSVSRIIRRLRGEGLSKHYWMADEHCKECYDCKSVRAVLSTLCYMADIRCSRRGEGNITAESVVRSSADDAQPLSSTPNDSVKKVLSGSATSAYASWKSTRRKMRMTVGPSAHCPRLDIRAFPGRCYWTRAWCPISKTTLAHRLQPVNYSLLKQMDHSTVSKRARYRSDGEDKFTTCPIGQKRQ